MKLQLHVRWTLARKPQSLVATFIASRWRPRLRKVAAKVDARFLNITRHHDHHFHHQPVPAHYYASLLTYEQISHNVLRKLTEIRRWCQPRFFFPLDISYWVYCSLIQWKSRPNLTCLLKDRRARFSTTDRQCLTLLQCFSHSVNIYISLL